MEKTVSKPDLGSTDTIGKPENFKSGNVPLEIKTTNDTPIYRPSVKITNQNNSNENSPIARFSSIQSEFKTLIKHPTTHTHSETAFTSEVGTLIAKLSVSSTKEKFEQKNRELMKSNSFKLFKQASDEKLREGDSHRNSVQRTISNSTSTIYKPNLQGFIEIPELCPRVHSRKTIRMEGWVSVSFESGSHSLERSNSDKIREAFNVPIKKWCALEGKFKYIFLIERWIYLVIRYACRQSEIFKCL